MLGDLARFYLFILGVGCIIVLMLVAIGFAAVPAYFLLTLAAHHSWWIATAFAFYPAWLWVVCTTYSGAALALKDSLP